MKMQQFIPLMQSVAAASDSILAFCDNGTPSYERPSASPFPTLALCNISDLSTHLGKRASGLLLVGDLVVGALQKVSIMTVLADDTGHAVRLALYITPNTTGWFKSIEAFPKGLRIAIKEPHLKRRADGTIGIRADHPTDVIICCAGKCGKMDLLCGAVVRCSSCTIMYCSEFCRDNCKLSHAPHCESARSLGVLRDQPVIPPVGAGKRPSIALLRGLQSRPEWNGQRAEVHGYDNMNERYQVVVGSKSANIRPCNLQLPVGSKVAINTCSRNIIRVDLKDQGQQGVITHVKEKAGGGFSYTIKARQGKKKVTLVVNAGSVLLSAALCAI
jgi:hypothetical protein